MRGTLAMVRALRRGDDATPIVLMGYYNPIYRYGAEAFAGDATAAGVDGVIVVDLPPEEDRELCGPARAAGLDVIRLATPTSDDRRVPTIVAGASGFIYYVAIAGITGTRSAELGRGRRRGQPAAALHRLAGSGRVWHQKSATGKPRWPAPPMPRSSARPWSSASRRTSTRAAEPSPVLSMRYWAMSARWRKASAEREELNPLVRAG